MNSASGRAQDLTRQNNFDLIRLAAATQVMVLHGVEHLGVAFPRWLLDFISRFPGVPFFFVISGFLISRSFERHPDLAHYARNRALRIFPALYVCLGFSILTVIVTGYLQHSAVTPRAFCMWLLTQVTFLQFVRPHFLDGYATGTLNGSLWTIPVEMQFYVALPLLYWLLRARTHRGLILMSLVVLFMAANVLRYGAIDESMTTFAKAFKMSFIPYFYMFLLGVLGQQNVDRLLPVLRGKVVLWAGGYVAISYLTGATGMHSLNNAVNPLNVILMAGLALSAAFSWPSLGDRILHRNDISYGVYIFHMPIANLLIYESIGGLWTRYAIFIVSTIVAATLSWRLVERHALRLKVDALRPVRERPLVGLQT